MGLVSGLLGIGFVLLNIKVTRLRDALLTRYKWRRCIEPAALVVIYVTGTMLLPRLFPCTPTHCVTYKQQVYCGIQNVTAAAAGEAPPANTPPLLLPLYTCAIVSEDANSTWIPSSGTITPDTPTNASTIVYYNELATLMLNTGAVCGSLPVPSIVAFSVVCEGLERRLAIAVIVPSVLSDIYCHPDISNACR